MGKAKKTAGKPAKKRNIAADIGAYLGCGLMTFIYLFYSKEFDDAQIGAAAEMAIDIILSIIWPVYWFILHWVM